MVFQSPTTLYTQDVSPVPTAAIEAAGALLQDRFGGDISALRQALRAAPPTLAADTLSALSTATGFAFLTLTRAEAQALTRLAAPNLPRHSGLIDTLTDPRLIGRLNLDLVEFFVENRKKLDAPTFWEQLLDQLGSLNPLTRWQQARQKAPATPDAPQELQTLDGANAGHLRNLTGRYLRRLLNHPEKLDDPKRGGARADILALALPRLMEILNDPEFLAALPPSDRTRFENARNALSATLAIVMNDAQWPLLTDPHAYDLQLGDPVQGALHVGEKPYVADGYGQAVGHEIRIASTDASAPTVAAHGITYTADHAHWHLGATEHRLANDPRDLRGEIHIVHKNATGDRFLVLGAFIEVTPDAPDHPFITAILDKIPGGNSHAPDGTPASYLDFLPREAWAKGPYLTYHGTLTTEPYSDGVDFYLLKDATLQLNTAQYEALKSHLREADHNARPPQPYHDRTVIEVSAQTTTTPVAAKS